MREVIVKKKDLLESVKENRDLHRDLFLKAQKGYRTEVIGLLEQRLEDARTGKKIIRNWALPEPMDHTSDYDRVIEMLEMSVEDEIELSASEFDQYVRDNWGWQEQTTFVNTSYVK